MRRSMIQDNEKLVKKIMMPVSVLLGTPLKSLQICYFLQHRMTVRGIAHMVRFIMTKISGIFWVFRRKNYQKKMMSVYLKLNHHQICALFNEKEIIS